MNGSRYRNLWYVIEKSVRDEDLAVALDWLVSNIPSVAYGDSVALDRFFTSVCRRALLHIDDLAIRGSLAKLAIWALGRCLPLFKDGSEPKDGAEVDSGRRRVHMRSLVAAMALASDAPDRDGGRTVRPYQEAPFVDSGDVEWLVNEWRISTGKAQQFFAKVIETLVRAPSDPRVLEVILEEIGEVRVSPLLHMPRWIELGSDEAISLKASHDETVKLEQEWAEEARERDKSCENYEQRRAALLARALGGAPEDWQQFILCASEEEDLHERGLFEGTFRLVAKPAVELPRLVDCAKRYLATPGSAASFSGDDAVAQRVRNYVAYLSLRLLWEIAPQRDEVVAILRFWVHAVVFWDTAYLDGGKGEDTHRELLMVAFQVAKDESSQALRNMLKAQLRPDRSPAILGFLPHDACIGDVLIEFLSVHEYFPCVSSLVTGLFEVQRERALQWADKELRDLGRSDPSRQTEIVSVLVAEGRSDSWEIAWRECARDSLVASATLPRVTHRFEHDNAWGYDLTDRQVAAFYDWLEEHVPLGKSTSGHSEEGRFRQKLLNRLTASRTTEGLDLLGNLREKYPDNSAVKEAIPQAADLLREKSWQALTTEEFRSLAASRDARLVNSDEQLLDVVLEAMDMYQSRMRGETPAVADLWSYVVEDRRKVYWPKDEEDLSDHLARFLRDRLGTVVVNREVQIRPSDADRPGEKTDLLVQATHHSGKSGPFQVVIEVKGSWNVKLETDIEDQLRNRYLAHGDLRCGIYLVGWFECSNWDVSDKRCAATRRRDRRTVTENLEALARGLETEGRRVRAVPLDLTMGLLN